MESCAIWTEQCSGTISEAVKIFGDVQGVEVYYDDILVGGMDKAAHDEALTKVMERARENNVKFNETKLQYRSGAVKFMGHIVSSGKIRPDSRYIRHQGYCGYAATIE